jgi:hypothetical protein
MTNTLLPPKWGQDKLTEFFNTVENNTYATFANMPKETELAIKIDNLYRKALELANNSGVAFQYLFIPRAHSAYLAGVRLAMGTQVPESYMVARGCLENALYGFFLFKHPEHIELYLNRDNSDETRSAFKKKFRLNEIIQVLIRHHPQVGNAVDMLYERTIDWGAHPNEKALTSNMSMKRGDGKIRFDGHYLTDNEKPIKLCLKTIMLAGVSGLKIAECMLSERFKITLLSDELEQLLQAVDHIR